MITGVEYLDTGNNNENYLSIRVSAVAKLITLEYMDDNGVIRFEDFDLQGDRIDTRPVVRAIRAAGFSGDRATAAKEELAHMLVILDDALAEL